MRISRRQARKAAAKGITMNGGEPMRLRYPFDTLAVYNGAIYLTTSNAPGQELRVPEGSHAWLSGVIADGQAVTKGKRNDGN